MDRKTIFTSAGVALFVGGIAALAGAAGSIADAPKGRGLTVEWTIFGFAAGLVLLGMYAFVAALGDRLPMPGLAATRRQKAIHARAVEMLGYAVMKGQELYGDNPTREIWIEIDYWWDKVTDLVDNTWGTHEFVALVGSLKGPSVDSSSTSAYLGPVLAHLEKFLARSPTLALQHYPDLADAIWTGWGEAFDAYSSSDSPFSS